MKASNKQAPKVTSKVSNPPPPSNNTSSSQHPYQKFVKPGLTLETIFKLKQCFDIFDADHGGSISIDELTSTIKYLGLQKSASKILELVRAHGDVSEGIDFETFLEIFGFGSTVPTEHTLNSIFAQFDKDGKGFFTVQQFQATALSVGQKFSGNQVEAIIKCADKDQDGVINYQQFIDVVTKQYAKV